jgi:hypothetical protein
LRWLSGRVRGGKDPAYGLSPYGNAAASNKLERDNCGVVATEHRDGFAQSRADEVLVALKDQSGLLDAAWRRRCVFDDLDA